MYAVDECLGGAGLIGYFECPFVGAQWMWQYIWWAQPVLNCSQADHFPPNVAQLFPQNDSGIVSANCDGTDECAQRYSAYASVNDSETCDVVSESPSYDVMTAVDICVNVEKDTSVDGPSFKYTCDVSTESLLRLDFAYPHCLGQANVTRLGGGRCGRDVVNGDVHLFESANCTAEKPSNYELSVSECVSVTACL